MKIIYKQGDLLSCTEPIIAHGVNAQGVMGSGVAKAIKEKYPSAYQVYIDSHRTLGTNTWARADDCKFVVNMVTQQFYGRNKKVQYVSYHALGMCFLELNSWCSSSFRDDCPHVAMPKIGAGLGGGEWEVIEGIIERVSSHFVPVVYTL
jgi:O-acetyl-ADP-ribose deacetylase (regulator of RNase III)